MHQIYIKIVIILWIYCDVLFDFYFDEKKVLNIKLSN